MSNNFPPPEELPPNAPGRKLYAWLFVVVGCVILLSAGFDEARTLPANIAETCREFHICGPRPLGDMPALRTKYIDGIGAVAAAQPTLERYQHANPDYTVTFHPDHTKEKGSCDNALIKVDCRYSYAGTFSAEPKW